RSYSRGDERHALDLVGAARVERTLGDEAVVVVAHLADREAGRLDYLDIARARDRARDARGPELDVAARALLERLAADDVGEREPPTGPQNARGLVEHAVLHDREVDHAVRDHDVEARVVEWELIDARLGELHVRKAVAVAQGGRLGELRVGEV